MRRRFEAALLAALTLTACAPPLGVGPAPLAMPTKAAVTSFSTSYAPSSKRESIQASGSLAKPLSRFFAIEAGLVSTVTRVEDDSGRIIAAGGFPYARPTALLGPLQLGVALSGIAMGAGGGGFHFGVAEGRIAYSHRNTVAWASAMRFSSESLGGPRSKASETAGGFEVQLTRGATRIGVGVELRSGRTELGCGVRCTTSADVSARFTTASFKLRLIGGVK